MPYRTTVQLALLVVALGVWGYGQRADEPMLQYIGLGFFAAAFVLRFFRRREPPES